MNCGGKSTNIFIGCIGFTLGQERGEDDVGKGIGNYHRGREITESGS